MADTVRISDFSSVNFDQRWTNGFPHGDQFVQPFLPSDNIRIQAYSKTLQSVTVRITDKNGASADYSTGVTKTGIRHVYNRTITGLPHGCYRIEILQGASAVGVGYFSVVDECRAKHTVLITYTNDQDKLTTLFSAGEDQFYFSFRIDAGFFPSGLQSKVDNEDFRDQAHSPYQLYALPYETETLRIGENSGRDVFGVPAWVAKKINQIFSLSNVYIDGLPYVRSGSSTPSNEEIAEDSALFMVSFDVERQNEEEHAEEEEGGGEPPVTDEWVVRSGHWDDSGVWIDTDLWIDGTDAVSSKIRGVVRNQSTQITIEGVYVAVSANGIYIGSAVTGADGTYNVIWDLVGSEYPSGGLLKVDFSKSGFNTTSEQITLPATVGEMASGIEINAALTEEISEYSILVKGVITSAGVAVKGALASVYIGGEYVGSASTNTSGQYELAWITNKQTYNSVYPSGISINVTCSGYNDNTLSGAFTGSFDSDVQSGITVNGTLVKKPTYPVFSGTIRSQSGQYPPGGAFIYLTNGTNPDSYFVRVGVGYGGGFFETEWDVSESQYNQYVANGINIYFQYAGGSYYECSYSHEWPTYQNAVTNGIKLNVTTLGT